MTWTNAHSKVDTATWYKVPLTSVLLRSGGTAGFGRNFDLINDTMAWCKANGSNSRVMLTCAADWFFEDESDAILFSLVWSNPK